MNLHMLSTFTWSPINTGTRFQYLGQVYAEIFLGDPSFNMRNISKYRVPSSVDFAVVAQTSFRCRSRDYVVPRCDR